MFVAFVLAAVSTRRRSRDGAVVQHLPVVRIHIDHAAIEGHLIGGGSLEVDQFGLASQTCAGRDIHRDRRGQVGRDRVGRRGRRCGGERCYCGRRSGWLWHRIHLSLWFASWFGRRGLLRRGRPAVCLVQLRCQRLLPLVRFSDPWELRAGELVLDLRARTARWGVHALDLTATEWNLLECLMRHQGQALNRQQILDYVWSYERDVQPSMVDVYISYLRRKLNLPGRRDPIQTVRGVGYRLEARHV